MDNTIIQKIPNSNNKIIRWIAGITAGLVFLLAIGSFTLSYANLRLMASDNGIAGWLSYVWPLLIDASLVIFSLAVVNAHLHSESTWKQWSLVGIYTIGTIAFNVLHAPDNWQSRTVAAIAPVSLFFSFEILMSQLKNSVKRSGIVQALEHLDNELEQRLLSVQKLDNEIEHKRSSIVQLGNDIVELERSKKAASIVQYDVLNAVNDEKVNEKQLALNALLNFYRSNPDASLNEAGAAIERSKGTVSNYLNELEQAGLIYRNGQGVEVIA